MIQLAVISAKTTSTESAHLAMYLIRWKYSVIRVLTLNVQVVNMATSNTLLIIF